MRQKFSTKWKASRQPRKQRKYLTNAPLHLKRKMMSANLDKELRKKYGRSIEVRKGDSVVVMRGKLRKKTGKLLIINMKKMRVAIEGIQRTKKDGSKVNVLFHPSKLKIIGLNLDDKKRMKNKNEEKELKKIEKNEGKVEKMEMKKKSKTKEEKNVSKKTTNA